MSISKDEFPRCCPVCNGYGKVSKPPWVAGDQHTWTSGDTALHECPACQGTGILRVPET